MKTIVSLVLALTLAACGGGGGEPQTGGTSTVDAQESFLAKRPSSTATLTIVSPKAGETIVGSTVTLKVSLQGGKIIEGTTTDLKPGEGHLHVTLDGKTVSMTFGLEQEIEDVVPGSHGLRVEFVAADHSPFNPRVIRDVSFRTRA